LVAAVAVVPRIPVAVGAVPRSPVVAAGDSILAGAVAAERHTLLQAGALPMQSPVPRFITLPRAEGQHRTSRQVADKHHRSIAHRHSVNRTLPRGPQRAVLLTLP
jgi:hypothetical protein